MTKKVIRELEPGIDGGLTYDIPSFSSASLGDSIYEFRQFNTSQMTQDANKNIKDVEHLNEGRIQKAANSSVAGGGSGRVTSQAILPIRSNEMDNMQNKQDKLKKSKVYATQEATNKFIPIKFKSDGDTLVASFKPISSLSGGEFVFNELYNDKSDVNGVEPLINEVLSDKDLSYVLDQENDNLVQKAIDRAEDEYISKLEKEHKDVLNKLASLNQEFESVTTELVETKDSLSELEADLPEREKSSEQAGYDRAMRELKDRDVRKFEIEQDDYMDMLKSEWKGVDSEISKIKDKLNTLDETLPEIVINFVQSIIGHERKLNNSLINNLIRNALTEMDDLQELSFLVNPNDLEIVKSEYPDYDLAPDPTLPKGTVKLKTKIGEVELSIDKWIKSIDAQIREQFD